MDKQYILELVISDLADRQLLKRFFEELGFLADDSKNEVGHSSSVSRIHIPSSKRHSLKSKFDQLQLYSRLASLDHVTGLTSRLKFEEILGNTIRLARRSHTQFAILYMDLDGFKHINDTFGHDVGDSILQEVGRRIKMCVRETDVISRFGGDEFVLLLNEIENPDRGASTVAEKIMSVFSKSFNMNTHHLDITASMGISIFPNDGEDVFTLIKNADTAMYSAKENGKENYQFCSPELTQQVYDRLILEKELLEAIKHEENFYVVYQPKAYLKTGKMIGVEALLRWDRKDKKEIPIKNIILMAEEIGCMATLNEIIFKLVFKQMNAWNNTYMGSVPVSINLSTRNLKHNNLVNLVKQLMETYHIVPNLIEVEIGENLLVHEVEHKTYTLKQFKEMGVRVSIDAFGTGYSSFSYFKNFVSDILKIDGSFIRDLPQNPNDAAIIEAIIHMAHHLNIKVLALGVETKEQLDFLKLHDCDEVQGFYFSKPLLADALLEFVEKIPRLA